MLMSVGLSSFERQNACWECCYTYILKRGALFSATLTVSQLLRASFKSVKFRRGVCMELGGDGSRQGVDQLEGCTESMV